MCKRSVNAGPANVLYTVLYMAATRTQVYLTAEQRTRLDALGRREGKPLAELVREAVDEYLDHTVPDAQAALDATFGTLPDIEVPSRDEWDRG
jgi:predicted DNA-binding protein